LRTAFNFPPKKIKRIIHEKKEIYSQNGWGLLGRFHSTLTAQGHLVSANNYPVSVAQVLIQ